MNTKISHNKPQKQNKHKSKQIQNFKFGRK